MSPSQPILMVVIGFFLWTAQAIGQELTVSCPGDTTVRCEVLDDLKAVGHAEAKGGCGGVKVHYRDSVFAEELLVLRVWSAADTCGHSRVCTQRIQLLAGKSRLAVLPLENLAASEEGARVFMRLLEDAALGADAIETIPAADVEDALLRGRVRQPYLMDDNQRRKLASDLGADYFLVGSLLNYSVYDDAYSGRIPLVACALQLQRADDGKVVWSETLHASGNDGEWLFGLGVEHDITRLAGHASQKAIRQVVDRMGVTPCTRILQ